MDLIPAHALLDMLEMEQHVPVYQTSFLLQYWNYVSLIRLARVIFNIFLIILSF